MSINICKDVLAEDIEPDFELDLDGDEYGDNEFAIFGYAVVLRRTEWYDANTGEPWVTLYTSQGDFEMPAGHAVKVKVEE